MRRCILTFALTVSHVACSRGPDHPRPAPAAERLLDARPVRPLPPKLVQARDLEEGLLGPRAAEAMVRGDDDADWLDVYKPKAIDYAASIDDVDRLLGYAEYRELRWLTVLPLMELHRAGDADQLQRIAESRSSHEGPRVVAMIVMHAAGVHLPDEALLAVSRGSKDPETRMAAVCMLGWSTTPAARAEVLARLADRHEGVVHSAAFAAVRQKNLDAVQPLIRLSYERSDNRLLIEALGEIATPSASAALIKRLRDTLETRPRSDELARTLWALQRALGISFGEAGAHDARYYENVARATVLWWDEIRAKPLHEVRPALMRLATMAPVEATLEMLAKEGSDASLALMVDLIEAEYRARPTSWEFLAKVRILSQRTGERFEPTHVGAFADGELARHTAATINSLRAWWARRRRGRPRPP